MSVRSTIRAFPTLLRIGFAEAIAYRAEFFIWILTTTMPLIMLALWSAMAQDGPVGRFSSDDFVAYFLVTFIVRQLTSSWAAWELNMLVRQGNLNARLLRPVGTVFGLAVENWAALPVRLVVAVPVACLYLLIMGASKLTHDPIMWALGIFAVFGAWLITFLANVVMGALSLFMESSIKVMEVWLACYFVFSGYTVPVELFPDTLRIIANVLPFRYQIGLPVEIFTGLHTYAGALQLLLGQWVYITVFALLAAIVWRVGLKRYGAFGG